MMQLLPSLLDCQDRSQPPIKFTSLGDSRYGRLFAPKDAGQTSKNAHLFEGTSTPPSNDASNTQQLARQAGPAAVPEAEQAAAHAKAEQQPAAQPQFKADLGQELSFQFKPDIAHLINPDNLPEGSDIDAIHKGYISITPLRAAFALASLPDAVASQVEDSTGVCRW